MNADAGTAARNSANQRQAIGGFGERRSRTTVSGGVSAKSARARAGSLAVENLMAFPFQDQACADPDQGHHRPPAAQKHQEKFDAGDDQLRHRLDSNSAAGVEG